MNYSYIISHSVRTQQIVCSLIVTRITEIRRFFSATAIKHSYLKGNYSATSNGTLAVDGWAVTFGTARGGLGGLRPRPFPSSLY